MEKLALKTIEFARKGGLRLPTLALYTIRPYRMYCWYSLSNHREALLCCRPKVHDLGSFEK